MWASDSKVIEKRTSGDGRDCGNGGRYKDTVGNNPYKKFKFTGDCDEYKECIIDCEDGKREMYLKVTLKSCLT
jgi:hypothetical protein